MDSIPVFPMSDSRWHAQEIHVSRWSPTMDMLAVAHQDGQVQALRMDLQRLWASSSIKSDRVVSVLRWRPDGRLLATGYTDGTFSLMEVERGSTVQLVEDGQQDGAITSMSWTWFGSVGKDIASSIASLRDAVPPLRLLDNAEAYVSDLEPKYRGLLLDVPCCLAVGWAKGKVRLYWGGVHLVSEWTMDNFCRVHELQVIVKSDVMAGVMTITTSPEGDVVALQPRWIHTGALLRDTESMHTWVCAVYSLQHAFQSSEALWIELGGLWRDVVKPVNAWMKKLAQAAEEYHLDPSDLAAELAVSLVSQPTASLRGLCLQGSASVQQLAQGLTAAISELATSSILSRLAGLYEEILVRVDHLVSQPILLRALLESTSSDDPMELHPFCSSHDVKVALGLEPENLADKVRSAVAEAFALTRRLIRAFPLFRSNIRNFVAWLQHVVVAEGSSDTSETPPTFDFSLTPVVFSFISDLLEPSGQLGEDVDVLLRVMPTDSEIEGSSSKDQRLCVKVALEALVAAPRILIETETSSVPVSPPFTLIKFPQLDDVVVASQDPFVAASQSAERAAESIWSTEMAIHTLASTFVWLIRPSEDVFTGLPSSFPYEIAGISLTSDGILQLSGLYRGRGLAMLNLSATNESHQSGSCIEIYDAGESVSFTPVRDLISRVSENQDVTELLCDMCIYGDAAGILRKSALAPSESTYLTISLPRGLAALVISDHFLLLYDVEDEIEVDEEISPDNNDSI